jgi:hypothetical protein
MAEATLGEPPWDPCWGPDESHSSSGRHGSDLLIAKHERRGPLAESALPPNQSGGHGQNHAGDEDVARLQKGGWVEEFEADAE